MAIMTPEANKEICEKRGTHRVNMSEPCLQVLTYPPHAIRHCADCGARVKLTIDSPQKTYAEVKI